MEATVRKPQAVTVEIKKGGISATLNNIEIVQASGQIEIAENGEFDISRYARAVVNVPVPSNYGRIDWNGITLGVS